MGRKKELAKNTAILTVGKFLTKFVSFILLPLYTSLLTTDDYGAYDLLVTYGTLLLPVVNWQFDQGLFRFMIDDRRNTEMHKRLFSTLMGSSFLQVVLYTVIYLIIVPFLHIENSYFLLVYVIEHVIFSLLHQFVRGLGGSVKYTVASFLSTSVTTVLNVLTLVVLRMGLQGMYVSTIVGMLISIIYLIFTTKCWRYFSFKSMQLSVFKEVGAYSLPLIPNNLAWWVVNASDRLVIKKFINLSANGVYAVANKFPNIFIQFYNILNLSWTETVSLHFNDEDRDEFLTETMTSMFKLFSTACFLLTAFMPFVFPIMVPNVSYSEAYNHILILMYAMLFRVMVGLYSCVYVAQKNAKKIATTSIMAAIINLGVNLLLVGKLKIYAASLSTLIAFVVMAVIRYIDINREVKMRIRPQVALSCILIGIVNLASYYCGNRIIQAVVLLVTVAFAVVFNMDMAKSAVNMVKKKFHKS